MLYDLKIRARANRGSCGKVSSTFKHFDTIGWVSVFSDNIKILLTQEEEFLNQEKKENFVQTDNLQH